MNKTEFHIQKEKQEGVINEVIQTVLANDFPESVKHDVSMRGSLVINIFRKMRQEVYLGLEKLETEFKTYDVLGDKNRTAAKVVASNDESITVIQHAMDTKMADLIDQLEKETQQAIVNEMNFQYFVKNSDFTAIHKLAIKSSNEMKEMIIADAHEAEKEPSAGLTGGKPKEALNGTNPDESTLSKGEEKFAGEKAGETAGEIFPLKINVSEEYEKAENWPGYPTTEKADEFPPPGVHGYSEKGKKALTNEQKEAMDKVKDVETKNENEKYNPGSTNQFPNGAPN